MDLSWSVDRADDASLVRCRLRNDDAVPRRVRIESRFDAPVLPPRRAGVPEDGWDADGATLLIGPDERCGFGFAVPARPLEPPVEIAEVEPVDHDESGGGVVGSGDKEAGDSTVAAALRDLGEHRPPRAAVDGERAIGAGAEASGNRETAGRRDERLADGETRGLAELREDAGSGADELRKTDSDAVDDWLAAVEARIDRAERLTDADVATATDAVADAGGVDALADLDEAVADDAERLRAVSERAASLAERAAATDAPVEALERLA